MNLFNKFVHARLFNNTHNFSPFFFKNRSRLSTWEALPSQPVKLNGYYWFFNWSVTWPRQTYLKLTVWSIAINWKARDVCLASYNPSQCWADQISECLPDGTQWHDHHGLGESEVRLSDLQGFQPLLKKQNPAPFMGKGKGLVWALACHAALVPFLSDRAELGWTGHQPGRRTQERRWLSWRSLLGRLSPRTE